MPELRLTDKNLKGLKPAAGEATTRYWDTECAGLFANVGKQAVTLYAKAGGTNYKIGRWPEWTLFEARERCQEIRRKVAAGQDPTPLPITQLPSLREAFADFDRIRLAKRRPSTAREYKRQLELHLFPEWGDRPIDQLTRMAVVDIHAGLSRQGKTVHANRVIATISSLFGWLQKDRGYSIANPAAKVERNQEHGRETFLTPQQVVALQLALQNYANRPGRIHDPVASCIALCIATGARSGEVKAAQWSQFDDQLTVWTKPASTTKQNRVHRIPLGPAAQTILHRRQELRRDDEKYVFPGRGGLPHVTELKRAWASVAKAAGLDGVRLHDCRHTFASLAISAGVPLKVVGGLLGHSTIATTNRYAHLYDGDMRAAAGKVSAMICDKEADQ